MSSRCEAELCHNWTGQGCACEFLGIEQTVVCEQCGVVRSADGACPNCDDPDDLPCARCGFHTTGLLDDEGHCPDCIHAEEEALDE